MQTVRNKGLGKNGDAYVTGDNVGMISGAQTHGGIRPNTAPLYLFTKIQPNTNPFYLFLKRLFDIIVASLALILLSPIMLVTVIAIKIEDPQGKVFYNAPRGGKNGKSFICHKFRSMYSSADAVKASLMAQNEMSGPVFKIKNDPRVTKVGRVIRKMSIDELPQLYDVLRGVMSLVGPRPLPVSEEAGVKGIYKARELVKPGITCIWQVSGRNNIDFDRWMEMDIEYVRKQSTLFDLQLLIMTIPAVFSNRGAS